MKPVAWMMVNPTYGLSPSLHWEKKENWDISWEANPLYDVNDEPLLRQCLKTIEELAYSNTDKSERMTSETIKALKERLK